MKEPENIDKTIDTLCCDLKPCKRLGNPLWRSLLWSVIVCSYVLCMALIVGIEEDIEDRLLHPDHHYLFELILSFVTGIAAAIAAFFLSVPDCRSKNWFLSVPLTLFGVHMLWMLIRFTMEDVGFFPAGWFNHCWMDAFLMAGLPAALALFLIRKGATVYPRLLALNAVLAVASFSWIGIRLVCPFDTVGKAYFVNFLPFLIAGIVLGFVAKRVFRW